MGERNIFRKPGRCISEGASSVIQDLKRLTQTDTTQKDDMYMWRRLVL